MKVNLKYPVQFTPIVVELETIDDARGLLGVINAFLESRLAEDMAANEVAAVRKLRTNLVHYGVTLR